MTDANGNTSYYQYQEGSNYLTQIDLPPGNGETMRRVTLITRNVEGTIQKAIDPKGQTTIYQYDGLGQLREVNYGVVNGAPAFSVSYTFDANGNQIAMRDRVGSSSWTYDENNRVTSESRTQNGITKTARYSYFANGLLASFTTFDNQTVSFGYDAALRLISQTDPNDGGRAISYSYDKLWQRTATTFPSGVAQRMEYNATGDVDLLTLQKSDGTVLQRFDYNYGIDANGNITADYWNGSLRSVTELDGSIVSYSYDDLNRLVSANRTGTNPFNQSYTYDSNNNRTEVRSNDVLTTFTYDTANQLVREQASNSQRNYTYDRNGNLIADGTMTLTYDAANQWTGGTTTSGASQTFSYDGQGRRVSRTVGTERTDYWYNWMGLISETGSVNATYLRSGSGELLSVSSGGSTHNYAKDRLTTITGLVSTSGALVNAYSYDPYGQQNGWIEQVYNPFHYTSTYQDVATGFYQMGVRYYQPGSGRFTQLDPLSSTIFDGQRYAYAANNPCNMIDPSGMNEVYGSCGSSYLFMKAIGRGRVSWSYGAWSAIGTIAVVRAYINYANFTTGLGTKWINAPPYYPFSSTWRGSMQYYTRSGLVYAQLYGYVQTWTGRRCAIMVPHDYEQVY
jgi:RHS repeat-associated protein